MIALPQRQQLVADILEAQQAGVRLHAACEELGISVRSFERWHTSGAPSPNSMSSCPFRRL